MTLPLDHYDHQWENTRWWRVAGLIGKPRQVWCETSDKQEAQEALTTCPYAARLERLQECQAQQWVEDEI